MKIGVSAWLNMKISQLFAKYNLHDFFFNLSNVDFINIFYQLEVFLIVEIALAQINEKKIILFVDKFVSLWVIDYLILIKIWSFKFNFWITLPKIFIVIEYCTIGYE